MLTALTNQQDHPIERNWVLAPLQSAQFKKLIEYVEEAKADREAAKPGTEAAQTLLRTALKNALDCRQNCGPESQYVQTEHEMLMALKCLRPYHGLVLQLDDFEKIFEEAIQQWLRL